MKTFIAREWAEVFALLAALTLTSMLLTASCGTPITAKTADQALTATQIGCVIATALSDEEAVAKACDIADDLLPVVRRTLFEKRALAARMSRCGDAGAP